MKNRKDYEGICGKYEGICQNMEEYEGNMKEYVYNMKEFEGNMTLYEVIWRNMKKYVNILDLALPYLGFGTPISIWTLGLWKILSTAFI